MSSIIETVADVDNTFLSRREIVCNFIGFAGKLKKIDAIDMMIKKFDLGDRIVIPVKMENHVGKTSITCKFYVYQDDKLAKEHVNPSIMKRLEKAKKAKDEAASAKTEEGEKAKDEAASAKTEDNTKGDKDDKKGE